jgi:NADPH:quinone reductase-like Zn-dependent oxidoreductase
MKAVVLTRHGSPDGLQLKEVEKPALKDNEVLVKVHATSVTAGDTELRGLKFPFWLWLPIRIYTGLVSRGKMILGQELSGRIEAFGPAVQQFKQGDSIFAATGFGFGGYAEYVALPAEGGEGVIALKPQNMSYEEAAVVPVAGLEALHFLKNAHIQAGEKVLIYGAGGSIGSFGVQLAKHYGAEVTGLDSSAKLDMLRSIGADHVIDYTREDFSRSGKSYDVIFDVIGKSPFARSVSVLKPNGRYLIANPKLSQILRRRWVSQSTGVQFVLGPASRKPEDLKQLKDLIEAGTIKAVIDRAYPLEQAAEAHRYVETGRKQGNVVITVA